MTSAHRLISLLLLALLLVACGGSAAQPTATQPSETSNQTVQEPTAAPATEEQGAAPTVPATAEEAAPAPATTAPTVSATEVVTEATQALPAAEATVQPTAAAEPTTAPTVEATTEPVVEPTAATTEPTVAPTEEAEETGQTGAAYTGTVVNASGAPVPGALVYVGDTMRRADGRGSFNVPAAQGARELTVMAPGYAKYTAPLRDTNVGSVRLELFVAKGLYVSGIGDTDVRERFYKLLEDTELNAIVINVKNDDGRVFTSEVPLAQEIGASYEDFYLKDVVAEAHKRGIYVIGRFTTFRDYTLANERPDLAVQDLQGNVWGDNQDHNWVDPFNQDVWEYFGDLGEEIAQSGIDEIQFDYVRFPVDGDLDSIKYLKPSTRVNRPQTITAFLKYMEGRLRPHKVFLSADTYGLTVVSNQEEGTGQIIERLAPYLDYYSPMIYPDHFAAGSFGYAIPTQHPYEVIFESVKRARAKLKGTPVLVRPYLSAFRDTQFDQPFGLEQFLAQKRGAEEAGAHGWIYWNAGLTYPDKLFRPEE